MSLVEGEHASATIVVSDVAVEQSQPLTSAQLAQQELDARSSLAQVALDREATFSKALTFMHACHASLYACLEELNRLNVSKETSEETLIRAETHACTVVDVVARAEDTRRFLVNRVRCAAWERKSHFHLTAIDHMLGNTQPALFDVASMLRGHLQICAMARSAMEAQTNRQFEIQAQLEIKEKAFKHVKELLESMEEQKSKSEEYKQILRDLKHKIGRDLERFIERKSRNKRLSTPASVQSPVESVSSNGSSSIAGLPGSSPSMGRLHTRSVSTFHASTLDASLANQLRALNLAALDTPMSDSTSHSSQLSPSPNSPATPRLVTDPTDNSAPAAPPPPKTSPHSPDRNTTMNAASPHSLSPPSSATSPMMSWPLPTAPQPTSLLVSSLAVADCWPDEELASSHIETLIHPVTHGHSSHAEPDPTLASADLLSPPVTPPPLNAFGSFSTAISASPGSSPATAIVTSPPRQQIAQFIKSDAPSSSLASSSITHSAGSSTPTHKSSSHSQENHERAGDRSPSPSSANKSPTTSRQGYLNIKMRYFQSLGQGRSPPQSPRPAQTTTSSFAAALALAGGATRRNNVEPNAAVVPGLPPIPSFPSSTDATFASSSSSPSPVSPVAGDSTSPTSPASPNALPSIRSRAMLATSEGDSTQHKRWMLRPLPANTSASKESVEEENERKAREMPELGPLLDSNVHDSASSPVNSTSPSATTSPTTASTAASSAPPKKSWWAALFSPRVKSPAELEKEREKEREKEAQRQMKEAMRLAEKAAKEAEKERKRLEKEAKKGLNQPPITRSYSSPEPSTAVTSPSATSEPSHSSASIATSSEVSASPEVAASSGAARLLSSEWKELQGLYDEIEALAGRQQENWERLELILDKRERVRAEERQRQAEEEKRQKEEAIQKEKEKLEAAAASAAAAAAALAEAARLESSSSTVAPSSSFTKVPSSHATVRSNASSPTPSSNGSGSSTPILAPNAERPARKSVLSLLQSVPAPTLALAPIPPLISIPPALATAFRNAVLDHLSRSTPSTPPPMGSEHTHHHHHHHQSFGGHGRRASDSQARPASAGSSPRSAPAGRSNSFSFAASSSQQNASTNQPDPLDLEYAEQRARYVQQHRDSPPSPSSLVF